MSKDNSNENLLTVKQVAERLNVSEGSIRLWASQGKLTAYNLGRLIRFKVADVDAMAKERN